MGDIMATGERHVGRSDLADAQESWLCGNPELNA